jgi:hypothetical protein
MELILLVAVGVALAPVVGAIIGFMLWAAGLAAYVAYAYIADFLNPPRRS